MIAVDLADQAEDGEVGRSDGIGQCPERRLEADLPDGPRQRAARFSSAIAVDQRDVGADRSRLRTTSRSNVSRDLDLEVLGGELVEQLLRLQIVVDRRSRRP